MIHFSTNIYAKCLALLVKHDPLCEEGDHLEEEKRPFSSYVFTGVSCKMFSYGIPESAKYERDMVFTRQ